MKYCIAGSPRKNGNTAQLLKPHGRALTAATKYDFIWLYDQQIEPCIVCRICQNDWTDFAVIIRTICKRS